MAYFSSNFLEGETGEYHWTPYNSAYDVVPFQDSPNYSDFDLNEPKLIEYYPKTHENSYGYSEIMYSAYDFSDPKLLDYYPTNDIDSCDAYYAKRSEINYSMYSSNEPNVIEYDPTPYQTQYYISYNTIGFNEPDYVEYDPTPYDGGYDQTITYGKPLPPSDQICYPRPSPKSNGLPLGGFSYNSTPSPYGNGDSRVKPTKESKPNGYNYGNDDSFVRPIEESKPNDDNKSPQVEPIEGVIEEMQSNDDEERALVERCYANYGEQIEGYNNGNDYPWFGYDYGSGNGRIGGYEYEYDKKIVAQTQYGYGSDGMEYCESIFGYWPCLDRKNKKSNGVIQKDGNKGSKSEPWRGAAEYIFGSSLGADFGNGCESYYRRQPGYGQEVYYEKCDESSWSLKFS